jgi:hypothetical protein
MSGHSAPQPSTVKFKEERKMPRRRKNPSWPGLYQIVEGEDSFTLKVGVPADMRGLPGWIWELMKEFYGLQRYPVTVIQRPYCWHVDVEGDVPECVKHAEFDLMYWLDLFNAITRYFTYPYEGTDPALYGDDRGEHDLNHRNFEPGR